MDDVPPRNFAELGNQIVASYVRQPVHMVDHWRENPGLSDDDVELMVSGCRMLMGEAWYSEARAYLASLSQA